VGKEFHAKSAKFFTQRPLRFLFVPPVEKRPFSHLPPLCFKVRKGCVRSFSFANFFVQSTSLPAGKQVCALGLPWIVNILLKLEISVEIQGLPIKSFAAFA
jgi:hypothetical protein